MLVKTAGVILVSVVLSQYARVTDRQTTHNDISRTLKIAIRNVRLKTKCELHLTLNHIKLCNYVNRDLYKVFGVI